VRPRAARRPGGEHSRPDGRNCQKQRPKEQDWPADHHYGRENWIFISGHHQGHNLIWIWATIVGSSVKKLTEWTRSINGRPKKSRTDPLNRAGRLYDFAGRRLPANPAVSTAPQKTVPDAPAGRPGHTRLSRLGLQGQPDESPELLRRARPPLSSATPPNRNKVWVDTCIPEKTAFRSRSRS